MTYWRASRKSSHNSSSSSDDLLIPRAFLARRGIRRLWGLSSRNINVRNKIWIRVHRDRGLYWFRRSKVTPSIAEITRVVGVVVVV